MNAKEFVARWKYEKEIYLKSVQTGDLLASRQIAEIGLSSIQTEQLWKVLDTTLTDIMYTLLLGLDGSASIGDVQEIFEIRDESGNIISTCDELEVEAYEQLHRKA